MIRGLVVAAVVVASTAIAAGCKVKPQSGGQCTAPGRWWCADEQSALYCDNGTYVPVPCRGPRGCATSATGAACDDALGEEGEICISKNENHGCAVDHKKGLVCKEGRWALWYPCKGPDGCSFQAKTVMCDSTVADVGDPCPERGHGACSSDHKFLLVCNSTDKFERDNACRGPEGCHLRAKVAICDESVALEGDPCDTPDERSCSVDGKSQLICKSAKFVKERDCKRPCAYTSHRDPPRCDY